MFKTILVHARGTDSDAFVLETTYAAVRSFTPHFEVLHVRPDLTALMSRVIFAGADGDMVAVAGAVDALRKQAEQRDRQATDTYDAFCSKQHIVRAEFPPGPDQTSACFRDIVGDEVEQLVELGRAYDLIAINGGAETPDRLSRHDIGRIVANSGKPVLLVPSAPAKAIRTVAIAWKDTVEAARAVAVAMPILEKAERVHVLSREENGKTPHAERIATQLKWHRINALPQRIKADEKDSASAVIEAAHSVDADLLVMGGYGHSRLAETILGGFTRSVLAGVSLPVLILH